MSSQLLEVVADVYVQDESGSCASSKQELGTLLEVADVKGVEK